MDLNIESGAWKKMVNTFVDPPMVEEASVIDHGEWHEVFVESLERHGSDLLLIPRYMLKGTSGTPHSKKNFKKLLGEVNLLVVIF